MVVATRPRHQAGVREVKDHLSAYLARVRDGEDIVITDRGRPVARLTTVDPDVDRLQLLADQGVLRRATAARSLPSRRVPVAGSLDDIVADQRR
jgi:prevent-host-death family protein